MTISRSAQGSKDTYSLEHVPTHSDLTFLPAASDLLTVLPLKNACLYVASRHSLNVGTDWCYMQMNKRYEMAV